MFESLREWCQFPVNVHAFLKTTASGDNEYAKPVTRYAYRVDKDMHIIDKYGDSYMSMSQVYFPAEYAVSPNDLVSFPDDVKPREVRKLGGFFDGNTGVLDIQVVYL